MSIAMNVPQIDNGKTPDEPANASQFFWLPPDSPYGNFQLKLFQLSFRLDEANRRLHDSCRFWQFARPNTPETSNAISLHIYANEEAVYLMRRAADEIISLIS